MKPNTNENPVRNAARLRRGARKRGKVLVLLAILLPTLCGLIGLVVDGGLLLATSRQVQHVADAAATAAAMEKHRGQTHTRAQAVAEQVVQQHNVLAEATVSLHCPPITGSHAGSIQHVEILVEDESPTYFMHVLSGAFAEQVAARSVAGYEPSTTGAAIVVLEADPPPFRVAALPPLLPSFPAIVGGLEVLGVGSVKVDGAVLVNTEWGGKDENGHQVGESSGLLGLSHATSATPVVGLSKLRCRDLRTVGGVDSPNNYGPLVASDPTPLQAGRIPVPDPFQNLPTPTIAVDPANVKATMYGGQTIVGIPLIGARTVLQPGVYDWIDVVSGKVTFQPGVYVIRRTNPATQMALRVLAGEVTANGVMFYLTDSANYTPGNGLPDASDGESMAPLPASGNTIPSVAINIGLLGSSFSGLNDPASPFDGILIYQRRHDRRPIVVVQENLLGPGQFRGTVYSKWGHVILAGKGDYDARFVAGTMRIVALLDVNIQPNVLLPPAEDVYLVE